MAGMNQQHIRQHRHASGGASVATLRAEAVLVLAGVEAHIALAASAAAGYTPEGGSLALQGPGLAASLGFAIYSEESCEPQVDSTHSRVRERRMALVTQRNISIVFPAYNEEDNIEKAVAQATQCLEQLFQDWEIIVVNDK